MRKSMSMVLAVLTICSAVLCSCGKTEDKEEEKEKNIIPGIKIGMSTEEILSVMGEGYVDKSVNYDYATDGENGYNYTYKIDSVEVFDVEMPASIVLQISENDELFNYVYHIGEEYISAEESNYPYSASQLKVEYDKIFDVLTEWYGEGVENTDEGNADNGISKEYIWDRTEFGDIWFIYGEGLWGSEYYTSEINEITLSCCDDNLR